MDPNNHTAWRFGSASNTRKSCCQRISFRHPYLRAAAITMGLVGGFSIEPTTWKPLRFR